jgi:hypothetical protein
MINRWWSPCYSEVMSPHTRLHRVIIRCCANFTSHTVVVKYHKYTVSQNVTVLCCWGDVCQTSVVLLRWRMSDFCCVVEVTYVRRLLCCWGDVYQTSVVFRWRMSEVCCVVEVTYVRLLLCCWGDVCQTSVVLLRWHMSDFCCVVEVTYVWLLLCCWGDVCQSSVVLLRWHMSDFCCVVEVTCQTSVVLLRWRMLDFCCVVEVTYVRLLLKHSTFVQMHVRPSSGTIQKLRNLHYCVSCLEISLIAFVFYLKTESEPGYEALYL